MIKRISVYLGEMYPLSSWLGTFLFAFMVQTVVWRLNGGNAPFELITVLSCVALCFFSLLLRVMDEFKDFELDLRLFPDRPLPSGRVLKSDLKVLGGVCVAVSLLCSAWDQDVFALALGVLFYSVLMLYWFGAEAKIRASLPLALITHHPIVFFYFFYLIQVSQSASYGNGQSLLIVPLCFLFTNWEISRKIRQPQDENDYVTYSKIWGPRCAVGLALSLQLIISVTCIVLINEMGAKLSWLWPYVLFQFLLMTPFLRFFVKLRAIKPLKEFAEAQILWNICYLLFVGWLG